MKIFLLIPSNNRDHDKSDSFRTRLPSYGIASIAGCLREAGHELNVEDQNASAISDERLLKLIKSTDPDIVGISCLTSTHDKVLFLCRAIKASSPRIRIVLGNIHASYFRELFFKTGDVDFIVHGEGERSFLDIAAGISSREISGISFMEDRTIVTTPKRPPITNLDELPFPAWDLFNLKNYRFHLFSFTNGELLLPVQASRGCRYHCDFCVQDKLHIGVRTKSVSRIIQEIEYIRDTFHVKYFGFLDAHFPVDETTAFALCDALERANLHKTMKWGTSCCVESLSDPMLKRMKNAGLDFINLGFESGDEGILKRLGTCDQDTKTRLHGKLGWQNECCAASGKPLTKKKSFEVMKSAKRLKIKTMGLFLLGLPGESRETVQKTIDFAVKLDCDLARFSLVIPFPGSKLYERYYKNDTTVKDPGLFQPLWYGRMRGGNIFNCTEMTDKELKLSEFRAIRRFYLRPKKMFALFMTINPYHLLKAGFQILRTIK